MSEMPMCPDCKDGRPVAMNCLEYNYSGTGTDMYVCPLCHHVFNVSYKIANMIRCPDW
jgi:transposase-like protein